MKVFVGLVVGFSVMAGTPSIAAPPGDRAASASKAGKALEDQLACLNPPKPGQAIRAMLANGLIRRTKFGADGSPVFAPTGDLYVHGKRVTFITGWEMEGEAVKAPFWRGPGTSPPLFFAVTLDAAPRDIPYTARGDRRPDGSIEGSFSSIGPANEYYSRSGTVITCHGG